MQCTKTWGGFQPAAIVWLLGDLYELVSVDVTPYDAGFHSVQRPRIYSILYLRGRVTQRCSITSTYRALALAFRQIPVPYFTEFLIITEEELDAVESRLRKRRGFSPLTIPRPRRWEYLLTRDQTRRLDARSQEWRDRYSTSPVDCPHSVFDLGWNCPRRTTTGDCLPTVTGNCGVWWLPYFHRWFLSSELASACGCPVRAELAAAAGCVTAPGPYSPQQVGNAMHVANVGVVLATALSCLEEL